jgi:hypothetical protein
LVQVKHVTFHSEAITIDSYQEEDGTSVRMEGEPLTIQRICRVRILCSGRDNLKRPRGD